MAIRKERNRYTAAVIGTMLFGVVYELFSHQVYSNFMIFAFLFPFLLGTIPYSLLGRMEKRKQPGPVSRCLYNSGVAALTAGSVFQGVLVIYGTTSRLSKVYWIGGITLILVGVTRYILERRGKIDS